MRDNFRFPHGIISLSFNPKSKEEEGSPRTVPFESKRWDNYSSLVALHNYSCISLAAPKERALRTI